MKILDPNVVKFYVTILVRGRFFGEKLIIGATIRAPTEGILHTDASVATNHRPRGINLEE